MGEREIRTLSLSNWKQRIIVVKNVELTFAVLGTLRRIGGKDDLELVAELASAKARDETAISFRLAAERCLSDLQLRVEAQRTSETLLRASEPAEPDLLRAAAPNSSDTDQSTLLRPGSLLFPI
jgi:hypothetical protein